MRCVGCPNEAHPGNCISIYPAEPANMTGTKHDQGKTRLDLLPMRAVREVGQVLTFGSSKYDDNNWRGGMKWGRLIGAALRHTFAFMTGEDMDPESGIHHLAHAATDLLFVLEYVITKTGEDDRPVYPKKVELPRC